MRTVRSFLALLLITLGATGATAQTTRTVPSTSAWSDICTAPCSVKALNGTVFFVLDTAPPATLDAPQIAWTPDNGLLPNIVPGVHVYARVQNTGASVSSIPSAANASGGSGSAANPYPGSDYATAARQDFQSASLGAPADTAYTGTGNAGSVALGKGQYAILSSLLSGAGVQADIAATTTGSNGTQVALLKALRDKLNGTITVQNTAATPAGTNTIGAINNLAAVTTAQPSYTNGSNAAMSLDAQGSLRTVTGSRRGLYTPTNGTITAANTSQQVLAANANRASYTFCNVSNAIMYVNFGANAATNTLPLASGGCLSSSAAFVTTQAINALGGTAGQAYFILEGN